MHHAPQLAQLASKFESKSHSIRLRLSPCSSAAVHFRQKRISFNQCLTVNAGTSTANGDIASVHGLSQIRRKIHPQFAPLALPYTSGPLRRSCESRSRQSRFFPPATPAVRRSHSPLPAFAHCVFQTPARKTQTNESLPLHGGPSIRRKCDWR